MVQGGPHILALVTSFPDCVFEIMSVISARSCHCSVNCLSNHMTVFFLAADKGSGKFCDPQLRTLHEVHLNLVSLRNYLKLLYWRVSKSSIHSYCCFFTSLFFQVWNWCMVINLGHGYYFRTCFGSLHLLSPYYIASPRWACCTQVINLVQKSSYYAEPQVPPIIKQATWLL